VPTARHTVAGLLPAQLEAYRACLSPGVRLVWGPPGTGKTRVLASAIEELVCAGKRVLIVSTANVAVDNALRAVVSSLPPRPGVAVRVGTAFDEKIATDPDVQLELLAARSSSVGSTRPAAPSGCGRRGSRTGRGRWCR
jgi:superfamily I DNA/RNA helicase